ncbi:MAG: DMT family transporter [Clostridia bacterium]|nr:DMT family transporter [Clostridia bacterium]
MFIVIIATVLLAFTFALQKKYQQIEGSDIIAGLKFNAVIGLLTAVIFLALLGFKIEFSAFSAVLAFAMALFSMLYSVIGFKILKLSGMAIYSIFLMSGGMLLPYFYGVLFLDEELSLFRIAGVVIILVAVILSNKAKHSIKTAVLIYCVAVFVLNGFVSIVSKAHQINETFAPVSSTAFVMYTGIFKALLSSAALLFLKPKRSAGIFSSRFAFLISGAFALLSGVSYMLQLIGAKELPATVLYPIVTGGSIVFSTLSGRLFFKEKISCYQLVSVALCFIGTILFL